ncbi:MAG TPA: glycoside hydrolase family 2 TIM barrel-domain containing protein [Ohtaekwangia sp.]|uniref:glycoside hydrolase family 2 protein n=1 Tax=Ohtaekwangia sp. TaxID=2066019 RepID=UPI002F937A7E
MNLQTRRRILLGSVAVLIGIATAAQDRTIGNIPGRKITSLDGIWQYIIDPYETGFYNYRFMERAESDREAYWNTDIPNDKSDRKEHGYSDARVLKVPGDWNSQDPTLLYYEGTIWYKKTFNYTKTSATNRLYLYFGAVNYQAHIYLNGKKLGSHKGGFTPFNLEIPDNLLKPTDNFLVVKVDNKRLADEIPTLNTDWWNYGGITRSVQLVELPSEYIADYMLQLDRSSTDTKKPVITGWVNIAGGNTQKITIEIPELKVKKSFAAEHGTASVRIAAPELQYWSPENPKIYTVNITSEKDKLQEKIGFRTIDVKEKQVLLNGKPVFLKGICIHEEIPEEMRRAHGARDAVKLLSWAKDLGCNIVRLAHYPHNESMTRVADSLGLMVWSEIPVYWTINFASASVYENAKQQLIDMINRDHNRASVVLWSVGNETPVSAARNIFMKSLLETARAQDATRLVSAALEVTYTKDKNIIDDPLGEYVDIVAVNEYLGWYSGLPDACAKAVWEVKYNKPLFFSETGAEAVSGFHADQLTRWSEEYQEYYFQEQIAMMKRMPDNFVGWSPWILADFKSPRRNNPYYQEGWNNKGLISQKGLKKKAFYTLKNYYHELQHK